MRTFSLDNFFTRAEFDTAGTMTTMAPKRLHKTLSEIEADLVCRLRSVMSFLATVGATGPLTGLFGTVWEWLVSAFMLNGIEQRPEDIARA